MGQYKLVDTFKCVSCEKKFYEVSKGKTARVFSVVCDSCGGSLNGVPEAKADESAPEQESVPARRKGRA